MNNNPFDDWADMITAAFMRDHDRPFFAPFMWSPVPHKPTFGKIIHFRGLRSSGD